MNRVLAIVFTSLSRRGSDAWNRRRDRRYNDYWGLESYNEDTTYSPEDVSDVLAKAGAAARSGCPCVGCRRLLTQAAEIMARPTADDLAELDRIGISWGTS